MLVLSRLRLTNENGKDVYGLVNPVDAEDGTPYILLDTKEGLMIIIFFQHTIVVVCALWNNNSTVICCIFLCLYEQKKKEIIGGGRKAAHLRQVLSGR